MQHHSSYLSERQYLTDSDHEYNEQRYGYWKKMLGERSLKYILENVKELEGYLKQSSYTLKENTQNQNTTHYISDRLEKYIESAAEKGKKIYIQNLAYPS